MWSMTKEFVEKWNSFIQCHLHRPFGRNFLFLATSQKMLVLFAEVQKVERVVIISVNDINYHQQYQNLKYKLIVHNTYVLLLKFHEVLKGM